MESGTNVCHSVVALNDTALLVNLSLNFKSTLVWLTDVCLIYMCVYFLYRVEKLNNISHLRLDRENIGQIDNLELLGKNVTNVYLQQVIKLYKLQHRFVLLYTISWEEIDFLFCIFFKEKKQQGEFA